MKLFSAITAVLLTASFLLASCQSEVPRAKFDRQSSHWKARTGGV